MTRERRQFHRTPHPFEVRYRQYGQFTSSWAEASTINISAGGIRFRSPELLERGTALELEITIPSMREALVIRGQVAWSQLQASGVIENGVQFTEVSSEQQLRIDELVRFLRSG